ncbi:hypothetical protein CEXT_542761 [Caerostris extrusa]|uniref:Uncharacterized protein n=1 Tax=Caerostris extrusa TaxID=172846 RepID=A0AAV4RM96_CAEEX|nr:hypothetical protein CEXT_542761 [Caerostris extrusa]
MRGMPTLKTMRTGCFPVATVKRNGHASIISGTPEMPASDYPLACCRQRRQVQTRTKSRHRKGQAHYFDDSLGRKTG